jgi:mannose-6-phosphate isomerase-like protein (cupin superfamily)
VSAIVRQLATCDEEAAGSPGVSVRTTLSRDSGCPRLVQRQLRLEAGARADGEAQGAGELWYVADGAGTLSFDGRTCSLRQGTALLVPPGGHTVHASADADLELVVVVLPVDARMPGDGDGGATAGEAPITEVIETHFDDSPEERTGDRTFRVLIGAHQGFTRATQFVGNIPPSRAPLHEHTYDEVVMVLEGGGVVHVDDGTWDLAPGTCIYLPPGTKHCLENNGEATLRVLGVFCPGGTPAAKREHP